MPELLTMLYYVIFGPVVLVMLAAAAALVIYLPISFFWYAIRGIAPARHGYERIGIGWRLACVVLGLLTAWGMWFAPWVWPQ